MNEEIKLIRKSDEEILMEITKLLLDKELMKKQLDKYKNVIDKIKEEIEIFNSVEYNANNFTILSLITKINELLEEVE